jgi:hypothetical protein
MIARARTSGRFSVVGLTGQRQTLLLAVNARGAHGSRSWILQIYKSREREGRIPYLAT